MIAPLEIKKKLAALLGSLPLPKSVESEIVFRETETRSVAWADRKPSLNETALESSYALRVLEEGRQGAVGTRSLDPERVPRLAAEALELARATPADPHRRMGRPARPCPSPVAIDTRCFSRPLDEIQSLLSDVEKKILKIDPRLKKVIKFHWTERRGLKALVNSHTAPMVDESTVSGFAAEVLAEDGGQTEVAWDYQGRRYSEEMDVASMAEAVARHAAASLGGKPLASGKYTVMVHPRVGTQLLELVAQALSAEAVQRGRSFLRGLRDQRVASQLVSIIDDPLLPNGVASATFDDEGTPHQRLDVFSRGVLMDYFYDLRSASIDNRESNGHGPQGTSTNFFIEPGETPVEKMLNAASRVFLLQDVMGLHMADPITGEFSLGASGSLYENGCYSRPVRGVTIAGTVASMLKGVSAVGPDLTWLGSTGAPSFLVPNVTVAGN